MNSEAIAAFASGWPAGQNHPRAWLALQRRKADAAANKQAPEGSTEEKGRRGPIEHGICLRLRLPYGKARITDLRLNGHPLASSETDGYVTWVARGCTFIEVNIPPKRLLEDDLFVVTCDYDPVEKRVRWDSWKRVADGDE